MKLRIPPRRPTKGGRRAGGYAGLSKKSPARAEPKSREEMSQERDNCALADSYARNDCGNVTAASDNSRIALGRAAGTVSACANRYAIIAVDMMAAGNSGEVGLRWPQDMGPREAISQLSTNPCHDNAAIQASSRSLSDQSTNIWVNSLSVGLVIRPRATTATQHRTKAT